VADLLFSRLRYKVQAQQGRVPGSKGTCCRYERERGKTPGRQKHRDPETEECRERSSGSRDKTPWPMEKKRGGGAYANTTTGIPAPSPAQNQFEKAQI